MTKLKLIVWQVVALGTGLLLTGCAGKAPKSTERAAVAPPAQEAATRKATLAEERLRKAVGEPVKEFEGEGWHEMAPGGSLAGWKETPFAGRGEVEVTNGVVVFNMGDPFTGLTWTNPFPKVDYEVALDAMRLMGSDFFCGLTVPVDTNFCSLIVGGWGGSLLGLSSLDGMDASENETTKYVSFETGKWYRIRLRVTKGRIEGWLDSEKLVDVNTADKKISVRPGDIELSMPFGIASWQTAAVIRGVRWRSVDKPADPPKKER